jgi:hypothetical protein
MVDVVVVKRFDERRQLVKKPNLILKCNPVKVVGLADIVENNLIKGC